MYDVQCVASLFAPSAVELPTYANKEITSWTYVIPR